jgi:hypothetical protein
MQGEDAEHEYGNWGTRRKVVEHDEWGEGQVEHMADIDVFHGTVHKNTNMFKSSCLFQVNCMSYLLDILIFIYF